MDSLVVIVAVLQYLLAATFLVIPVIAYRYGHDAQRAAEHDLARQGYPATVLARHKIKFTETAVEALFPFAIAVCLAVLASLNLAGVELGRILSWIVQPIMLVGGGLITAGQVFPTRFIEGALAKSGEPTRGIDVGALVRAASDAFPGLLRPAVITRFLLTTVGSVVIIVLLSLSGAVLMVHATMV